MIRKLTRGAIAFVVLCLTTTTCAQAGLGEKINLRVELDARVVRDLGLADKDKTSKKLSESLLAKLNERYWGDYCWVLTTNDAQCNADLVIHLYMDGLDNWAVQAKLFTKLNGANTKILEPMQVIPSDSLLADGAPGIDALPDLLSAWFCERYLQKCNDLMHKELSERLPVGIGVVSATDTTIDYSIYLPTQFRYFYRSVFIITGNGPALAVRGNGDGGIVQFQGETCVRVLASPQPKTPTSPQPPTVPQPISGPAYLIKHAKPSEAASIDGMGIDGSSIPLI